MNKYIFKDHGNEKTLEVKGWGYKMLPSGNYMILNSGFYDKNPIVKSNHWYLAKVEVE